VEPGKPNVPEYSKDENAGGAKILGQKFEQEQRRPVRPVQIVQDDDQGLITGRSLEKA
jgi:hypothetical protein